MLDGYSEVKVIDVRGMKALMDSCGEIDLAQPVVCRWYRGTMQEAMAADAERSAATFAAERKDAEAIPALSRHLRSWQ
jgi:hypothetical protein